MITIRRYLSMTAWQKTICLLMAAGMLLSAFMTGSYAWNTLFSKENVFTGTKTAEYSVELHKFERSDDGEATEIPIPGTTFYLYRLDATGRTQIGGHYVTDTDGRIMAGNLASGDYVFVESSPGYGYTYDKDGDGNPITEYPFTVNEDTTNSTAVVNAYNPHIYADLIITKTVKNADSTALTPAQEGTLFEFTVVFTGDSVQGDSFRYTIDGSEAQVLPEDGKLYLQHGQTALFTDLPVGTLYTVIETPITGYAIRSSNHQGNITDTGAVAEFTNTCTGTEYGRLNISKSVTGEGAEQAFVFTAKFSDGVSYPYTIDGMSYALDAEGRLTLKDGEIAVFDYLPPGITYTITEDETEGYTAGMNSYKGEIAANAETSLPFVNHYDGGEDEETGALAISKTLSGQDADMEQTFSFVVTFDGEREAEYTYKIGDTSDTLAADGRLTLKHGETAVFEGLPVGLGYTVTEENTEDYTATIKEVGGVIIPTGVSAAFHNIHMSEEKATLTVRKITEGEGADKGKEFSFTVVINGEETRFTLKDSEERSFELPVGAAYAVYEDDNTADGYVQSTVINGHGTAAEAVIEVIKTNTYIGEVMIQINGEKTWDMSASPDAEQPERITVYLMDGSVKAAEAEVTPDEYGRWNYTFTVPKYDNDSNEIIYIVEEKPIDSFTSTVDGYNIQNTYIPPARYSPTVEKKVSGDIPKAAADFTFKLTAQGDAPMPDNTQNGEKTITITGSGEKDFGEIQYIEAGTYTYAVTETKGGEEGYSYDDSLYALTIVIQKADGRLAVNSAVYTKSGDTAVYDKAVFNNSYTEGTQSTTSVRVSKVWSGSDSDQPASVEVQLYQDGIASGESVTLSTDNSWTHTWTDLEQDHTWTVDEVTVPDGYVKTITGNAAAGYVITNAKDKETPAGETVDISGSKTWVHGENPASKCPASITIFVMDGSYIVQQRVITGADGWTWSFTLPKYDEAGREISYTVDEADVSGYTKKINGYNITNTYTTGSKGNSGGTGSLPKTNDSNNMIPWFILMVVSAFTIRFILFRINPVRKKSK